MNFGVLTLATQNDYLKAIGLSLSLRVSNPDIPTAVAFSGKIRDKLEPYFDHVIEQDASWVGFAQKVNLDKYSPFELTIFFDSDILVFRELWPFLETWGGYPYAVCGLYQTSGFSDFGLDRKAMLQRLNKDRFVVIDGAGHGLFRKPDCFEVFEKAREITLNFQEYVGNIRYADEDVIAIVMTAMDIPPVPYGDFFSRYLSAVPGTLDMDARIGRCKFIAADTGKLCEPCMMHFASNEAPIAYTMQLIKLFNHFGVPTDGLFRLGVEDFYDRHIKLPLHIQKSKFKGLFSK